MEIWRSLICILLTILFCPSCQRSSVENGSAVKILHNGTIYTVNSAFDVADAVAIKDDIIIAVGTYEEVVKQTGTNVTEIDLEGKWLLPGLVDSHVHAIKGGDRLLTADVNDELLSGSELASFAQNALASGRGVRGNGLVVTGMHSGMWSRTQLLDSIFNNPPYDTIPALLSGTDGHTAWANAALLQLAKVNRRYIKSLPAKDQKYFKVNQMSEPTGFLSERAIDEVEAALPPSSITAYEAALRAIDHLNSLGITAWMDPSAGSVSDGMETEMFAAYSKASSTHQLTARVVALVVANGNDGVEAQMEALQEIQRKFSDSLLTIPGFKIFLDGVLEYPTQTAAISRPYQNTGTFGSLMVSPENLEKFVVAADRNDLMVHIHAIGDHAVSVALNAFASARENNGSELCHSITHLQLVVPEDHERFAKLKVIPSMQLLWANADLYTLDLVKPYVDTTLYNYHYPARSLVEAGATLSGASDWPVSSANPFNAISVAETRQGPLGVLIPGESVSRRVMIEAYTINAAKALRMNQILGSIEVGKKADLVLVDRDVMTVDAESVADTRVLWTMFGGKFVFRADRVE